MFSGFVKEIGEVLGYEDHRLRIKASFIPKIGDSIACNGACLSVIELFSGGFSVGLSEHSSSMLNLYHESHIHLERAIRLSDRLDGHLVYGHIDALTPLLDIEATPSGHIYTFALSPYLAPLILPQGSVCVNGISLTIARLSRTSFSVAIIPITYSETLFHTYKIGQVVQIESDVVQRGIVHALGCASTPCTDALAKTSLAGDGLAGDGLGRTALDRRQSGLYDENSICYMEGYLLSY